MDKSERFVYLMRAGQNHYKIGIAADVMKRIKGVQTGNPLHIELVAAVWLTEAQVAENALHRWLEDHKADGGREWFELTPEKALELIAKMTAFSIPADVSRYLAMRNLIARQTKLENMVTDFFVKEDHRLEIKETAPPKRKADEQDELYDDALHLVMRNQRASTSFLQRQLRIGYARAARIIDDLEKAGVIGEADGARARSIV